MEILASRILVQARAFDASLAFYEDALGLHRFREFGRPPYRGVVFFLGGGYLEVTETPPTGSPPDPPTGDLRVWLQVRDVARAIDELRASGVGIVHAPERKSWGLIEATVHDPDGLPIVLVEVPDDHPMRRDTR